MLQKFCKNKNTSNKLKLTPKNTTTDKMLTYVSATGTLTDERQKAIERF